MMGTTVELQSPCNTVHISLSGGRLNPLESPAYFFGHINKVSGGVECMQAGYKVIALVVVLI